MHNIPQKLLQRRHHNLAAFFVILPKKWIPLFVIAF
jgi:hypothetical protein